jgi:transcriptional regulator with XRE-family HTH domain
VADETSKSQPELSGDVSQALGETIKEARESSSMTQAALATMIGLSRASVANIERGEQTVTVPLLFKIADALQATPQRLLDAVAITMPRLPDLGAIDKVLRESSVEYDERAKRWIAATINRDLVG